MSESRIESSGHCCSDKDERIAELETRLTAAEKVVEAAKAVEYLVYRGRCSVHLGIPLAKCCDTEASLVSKFERSLASFDALSAPSKPTGEKR